MIDPIDLLLFRCCCCCCGWAICCCCCCYRFGTMTNINRRSIVVSRCRIDADHCRRIEDRSFRCCCFAAAATISLSSIADAPAIALLIDQLVLLLLLVIVPEFGTWKLWRISKLLISSLCWWWSIVVVNDAADQFFAVSPSNAKRTGVPTLLLRTASSTVCCDWLDCLSIVKLVGLSIVKLLWDRSFW